MWIAVDHVGESRLGKLPPSIRGLATGDHTHSVNSRVVAQRKENAMVSVKERTTEGDERLESHSFR